MRVTPFSLFFIATLAACGDSTGGGSGNENGAETQDGIFSVSNDNADGSSTQATGESSTTAATSDLNCEKIDFVFVIDNSSSMADEQANLVEAVPGFVEAMKTALPTVKSFRVGVVDTDAYPALGTVENPLDGCPAETADCAACDYTLGAFLDKPLSATDPESTCAFSTGDPFMEGASPTFADEFECAAIVGTGGNPVEQQVAALLASIDPAANEAGACNEGFLRDDALLVFLMITDEEDDHTSPPAPQGGSSGEPADWYAQVVAAKGGRASNAVGLGLIGGSPRFDDCVALSADGKGAEQSSRLKNFLGRFESHFEGSVCSNTYAGFFEDALATVAQGCMNFIP